MILTIMFSRLTSLMKLNKTKFKSIYRNRQSNVEKNKNEIEVSVKSK